jgi:thiol-disulfide isomerase/thioredoxin
MTRGRLVLAVFVLATIGGVAGYLAYQQINRAVEPSPAPLGPSPSAIPEARPLFSLQDTDGKLRSISEWDGKALVINFWATWCPPCRREIPMLNALHTDYTPRGVEVIGVAVDFRESVLEYLRKTPVAYPVLIGEQDGIDAAKAFGMETMGFPFTIFTDRKGRIVTIHVGELHRPDADAILAVVEEVDAGRLTPTEGRERLTRDLAAIKQQSSAP